MEERKIKQDKALYVMSLNPVLPIITRYFKISVPLIEGLYMLFIITYSFYWKLNSQELDTLSER